MSDLNHLGHALHSIHHLEPLPKKKNPLIAAVLGFFCGGIGIGLYFKSWTDFFVCIVLFFILGVALAPTGPGEIVTLLFAPGYGFFRAITSNEKIDKMAEEREKMLKTALPPSS